jgi:hypothetical protein
VLDLMNPPGACRRRIWPSRKARLQLDRRGQHMLLVAPGWVRTDMGGTAASLSVEESIPFVVDSVERSRGKPGLRFIDRNNRTLAW